MLIDIAELKKVAGAAQQVDRTVPLVLTDVPLEGPLRVRVRVTNAMTRILVHGELGGTVRLVCSRCAEGFELPLQIAVDEEFLPRSSPEVAGESDFVWTDMNVYPDEAEQIDLTEVARQNTLAALPLQPLCQEDCRGLCPVCGENRNHRDCGCVGSAPDSRWLPLLELQAKHRPSNGS